MVTASVSDVREGAKLAQGTIIEPPCPPPNVPVLTMLSVFESSTFREVSAATCTSMLTVPAGVLKR